MSEWKERLLQDGKNEVAVLQTAWLQDGGPADVVNNIG
jgi:hypothetical protein